MKERSSNFELLRIIAMFLIIAFHYCIHGNGGEGAIFNEALSGNQAISVIMGSWGIVGVFIFIFISAYFLLDSKKYRVEKVILIIVETSFYALIFLITLSIFNIVTFNKKELIKALLAPFTDQYWFISSYVMLFLIHPFLNKFINIVPRKTLLFLVIVLTVIIPFYRSIIYSAPIQSFSMFIYLYLLMGYLKFTPNNFFERNSKKGFIIVFAMTVVGYLLLCMVDQHIHIGIYYKIYVRVFGNRYSPITLLLAIFLFYIFKNLKMGNYKYINCIAKSTLGVYLIHENPSLGKVLWDGMLNISEFYYKPTYVLHMIGAVIIIFFVCMLIDMIRINTFEEYIIMPLLKRSKLISKINRKYNSICTDYSLVKENV